MKQQSLINALKSQSRAIMAVILLTTMASSMFFVVFTYMINYQIEVLHYAKSQAFMLNSVLLIIAAASFPLFGHIADKIDRFKLFAFVMISFVLMLWPSLKLMHSINPAIAFLGLCIIAMHKTTLQGCISPLFASLFEPEWQTSGCSFSYSIGNALGGGAPLLAFTMMHYSPQYGLSELILILLGLGSCGMLMAYRHEPETSLVAG